MENIRKNNFGAETEHVLLQKQSPKMFCKKKVFSEILQNSQENTGARASFFFSRACNFLKKENLAQVFSCEYFKVSKNTFWATASVVLFPIKKLSQDEELQSYNFVFYDDLR